MTKNALLLAALGTMTFAVLPFALVALAGKPEPVSDVASVQNSDPTGVPEVPQEADVRTMVASFYASSLAGNPTANGGVYRPERYTAAHRTLPLGTQLRISYAGRSVEVVINDRGPYVPGHDLDLSLAAAEAIGLVEPGTAPVRVTVL